MPETRRSNPKGLGDLMAKIEGLGNKQAKAGFFESSKYEDGTPVAYIAAIQEFGAHIDHPGGTPYKIVNGRAVFVSKAEGAGLPVTKPHPIVIPPRPFMRPTVAREQDAWLGLLRSGAKAALKGTVTAEDVMERVSARAAGDIKKTITEVNSPPLAKSTIAKRRAALSDKKTIGNLDKPLVASGIMLASVTNVVEDAK